MAFRQRLLGLFAKRKLDADLDEELRSHIEMRTEELIESGLPAKEARRKAVIAFGNTTYLKEEARSFDTVRWLETLAQDVRYGIRQLGRNKGFTFVAVATLALGIGATSLMFSVVNTVLLRPLPFPESERIVALNPVEVRSGATGDQNASYPEFFDWRAHNDVFQSMTSIHFDRFTLLDAGEPEQVRIGCISAGFFDVFGVMPAIGRAFSPAEETPGTTVTILSDALWRRRFHSDPAIVGKSVNYDHKLFTVVGVMPAGFQVPAGEADAWTTLAVNASGMMPMLSDRRAHVLEVFARLKPAVPLEQARTAINLLQHSLAIAEKQEATYTSVRMERELDRLVAPVKRGLLVLLSGVICLLLIACANVANLLLAKAAQRRTEVSVRAALGARRGRILRQLATESVVLWLISGAVGGGGAVVIRNVIVHLAAKQVPRLTALSVDLGIVGLTLLATLLTGLFFGLAPALPLLRTTAGDALNTGARDTLHSSAGNRVRTILVVSQVAMALVLFVSAALLAGSYWRLQHTEPGFRAEGVLTFRILMSDSWLTDPAHPDDRQVRVRFYDEAFSRLAAVPGIEASAAAAPLLLSGNDLRATLNIEGRAVPKGQEPRVQVFLVTPGYFALLGMRFLAGRPFTAHDTNNTTPVMIVSQTFARKFFAGTDPIGRKATPGVAMGSSEPAEREIVGVVNDVKTKDLRTDAGPQIYIPYAQQPIGNAPILVRAKGDLAGLLPAITHAVHGVDPESPVYNVGTLQEAVDLSLASSRFDMVLLVVFAAASVVLTVVGLYGVVAYTVAQRTREFGVRMAIGATRADVVRMVLNNGLRLALTGCVIGVAIAVGTTHLLSAMLYGVTALDPLTFVGTTMVLATIAILAAYIPARRASRVDPMTALRYE